jgi:AP-3 complex subunit mu
VDEIIDNGFPLTTESNILREMIAPPNLVIKVLCVVTGSSSNVSKTLPGAIAFLCSKENDGPKICL